MWKGRALRFASVGADMLDVSYMGPQLTFVQDLMAKGDLDDIINIIAPELNFTAFETLNLTGLENELKSKRVSHNSGTFWLK